MNKFINYVADNVIKIALTSVLLLIIFIGSLYIYSVKRDIYYLSQNIETQFLEQKFNQETIADKTFNGLKYIIIQLEEIVKQQQFIIDQNRNNDTKVITVKEKNKKPTYTSLKEHNVFIVGCAGKTLSEDAKISSTLEDEEEGVCWSGTGVVIKIANEETYLLTNNHVSGKGQDDVHLYIENGTGKVEAEIIAQHETVDIAVLKVNTTLVDKVEIPGIASAQIQDLVYTVGNPLGIKNVYSEGVVAGYEDVSILIQMPCIYGNSGSGVYDQNGNLVGLVFALEVYPGFMGIPEARITHSLVVDSVSIKSFLKDLNLYEDKE